MSPVAAHHRTISVEEELNNKMAKIPCSGMLIGSFQATPPLPSGLMNRVALVSGLEVMHGLSNMAFYSLRLVCLSA